ncbi:MAG: hypothetical protein B6D59_01765 [Campylobacteraceae bacterium 4484_4]|nr:MAG: hypothetical protein B6D59_01765 [Campylobacteraceae bacterium 4484_4]
MNKFKEAAKNSFFKREYKSALLHFALALKESPEDKEAKIGAVLSDMALEKEEEAVALFEYYEATRQQDAENADEIVENIIESVDHGSENLYSLIENIEESLIAFEDGIEYRDFKRVVEDRGNFKDALEDLMFSTKIIIHKKEDFVDFLNQLIEYDYLDIALNYLENALMLYPDDHFFEETLHHLDRKKRS